MRYSPNQYYPSVPPKEVFFFKLLYRAVAYFLILKGHFLKIGFGVTSMFMISRVPHFGRDSFLLLIYCELGRLQFNIEIS